MKRPPNDTPALYEQDGKGYDAIVHAHYFLGSNDWLVTEYDPADDIAFGWTRLNGDDQNAELGYTSLAELESIRLRSIIRFEGVGGLDDVAVEQPVEYDEDWQPMPLHDAIAELDRRQGRSS